MPLFQFLFLEQIDVRVAFHSPLGPGYVSEPGRTQHQRRVPVGEGPDYSCPPPDLFHDPLKSIVGAAADPGGRGGHWSVCSVAAGFVGVIEKDPQSKATSLLPFLL